MDNGNRNLHAGVWILRTPDPSSISRELYAQHPELFGTLMPHFELTHPPGTWHIEMETAQRADLSDDEKMQLLLTADDGAPTLNDEN